MSSNEPRLVQFSGEEYIKIGEIAKPFWENGVSENPPKLVVLTGGVGSGKTTIRRQKYSVGYVNFDFGDILAAVKKTVGEDDPKLFSYVSLACNLILRESIEAKKNIVIEIIGENKEVLDTLIDGMSKVGYKVSFVFIACEPTEAYKRHVKAVGEDPDYLSAHFTQEATLAFFYDQLGLGEMPLKTES